MIEERPVLQLILTHVRGYLREPEAVFWTYGFPLIMVIGLGIAFDSSGHQEILVDLVEGQGAETIAGLLEDQDSFRIRVGVADDAFARLHRNKTQIVVTLSEEGRYRYSFDPSNPESRTARLILDGVLQEAAGREDPLLVEDREATTPGSRYVDFLVPGLIGLNLMGGGMWGVGFTLVDLRMKKLLKRMLATPMKRYQLLLSVVGSRSLFFLPEVFVLLFTAHWIFGVPIEGGVLTVIGVAYVGAMSFSGLGLLAASRAQRIESISGILNLTMLPMWLLSGVFFSSERFPPAMQPFIQALPLTQLNNALRAVILEGGGLLAQGGPLLILALWGVGSFLIALRVFRWN